MISLSFFFLFAISFLFGEFNLYLKPELRVIHIVDHSSNTATLLQQWMTLLRQHKVTDISANKLSELLPSQCLSE